MSDAAAPADSAPDFAPNIDSFISDSFAFRRLKAPCAESADRAAVDCASSSFLVASMTDWEAVAARDFAVANLSSAAAALSADEVDADRAACTRFSASMTFAPWVARTASRFRSADCSCSVVALPEVRRSASFFSASATFDFSVDRAA